MAADYGDRAILTFLLVDGGSWPGLMLADAYLSVHSDALAHAPRRRGFPPGRRSGPESDLSLGRSLVKLFAASFGATTVPSQMLQGLYVTSALPQ